MVVTLSTDVLGNYRRFSLYNSPYPAHDRGCAIDCYPGTERAPSPVAGTVLDVRTVTAPQKPYAATNDHLLLIDTGEHVARILHVEPSVEPGDEVAVGDDLGELVRSGFFAPWVDDHIHLGFRPPGANLYRASGSLPIDVDVTIEPLTWDGTGTVVEVSETYVVLDEPAHPEPGARFVGIEANTGGVLDGGLAHYSGGGVLGGKPGEVSLLGRPVGWAEPRPSASLARDGTQAGDCADARSDSRDVTRENTCDITRENTCDVTRENTCDITRENSCDVTWVDVDLLANGAPIHGLSLSVSRDGAFGAKLVCPTRKFALGERVAVTIDSTQHLP